ncbi:20222_t:CDS:2, partial [Gigaspora margarita]
SNNECEDKSRQCGICHQKGHNLQTCLESNKSNENFSSEFSKKILEREQTAKTGQNYEDKSRQYGICH